MPYKVLPRTVAVKIDKPGDNFPLILTFDDKVHKALLKLEFGPLETFGQGLPYRAFDDPGAGKTDEGPRLGDGDVRQHGEGGGYPAGGGIAEDGEEGDPRPVEFGGGAGSFRHLQK